METNRLSEGPTRNAYSDQRSRRGGRSASAWIAILTVASLMSTGCTALTNPIHGIPADRVPPQLFAPPKNNLVPIDISLLTLEPPRSYALDSGDILGVYIEGVLPFNPPNATPELPPVNFPDEDSTLPPSIGFPIAVEEDGTLSLPLVEPIEVRGLTLDQVRDQIRQAYIEANVLRPENARPIVTLIRERTYNVIVIREDSAFGSNRGGGGGGGGSEFVRGSDRSGSGELVKLPAYQNDILHALVETGGLPGLNAKPMVKVLRASQASKELRAKFMAHVLACQEASASDPCSCPPPMPEDPTVLKIPLRLPPGVVPELSPADIMLNDGDIVYIESRDTEVFYTGGLLPGGEHPLPRDYDLDVLGAMAIAGQGIGATVGRSGGGMMGGAQSVGGVPPGLLYILRQTPCNGQVVIEVDINEAVNDPRQRPLVQAGDTLLLHYSCEEEVINFGLGTFFTFGIRELFRN